MVKYQVIASRRFFNSPIRVREVGDRSDFLDVTQVGLMWQYAFGKVRITPYALRCICSLEGSDKTTYKIITEKLADPELGNELNMILRES